MSIVSLLYYPICLVINVELALASYNLAISSNLFSFRVRIHLSLWCSIYAYARGIFELKHSRSRDWFYCASFWFRYRLGLRIERERHDHITRIWIQHALVNAACVVPQFSCKQVHSLDFILVARWLRGKAYYHIAGSSEVVDGRMSYAEGENNSSVVSPNGETIDRSFDVDSYIAIYDDRWPDSRVCERCKRNGNESPWAAEVLLIGTFSSGKERQIVNIIHLYTQGPRPCSDLRVMEGPT